MRPLHNPFSLAARVRNAQARVARNAASRRSLGGFLLKGMSLAALLAGAVVLLASRYSIAIATQQALCLPPYRVWLIDKAGLRPVRGATFAFTAQGLAPIFADGTLLVKVLQGLPGDRVEVRVEDTRINGVPVAQGLQVATQHGIDPSRYIRTGLIEAGRYWLFGRTADSFDSRYWGSVGAAQLIGRAYPLW